MHSWSQPDILSVETGFLSFETYSKLSVETEEQGVI